MADTVIHAEHISKVYNLYNKPSDRLKETFSITHKNYHNEFYALNDVSFSIQKGETIGIIGKNGSGKSTLLKILTGVLNPTEGVINVDGQISALLELGAGFNMDFTGMENIYLNGTIMNIPREEMEKKVEDILAFADIGDFINQPCKTYSSGMFVRLAFAVAINVNPDILIVDEALAVGDTRFQLKCMDKFMEFMDAGKTILFVSHDVNMIKRFCKRCLWINEGRLVMDGETDELTDRYVDFLKSGESLEQYMHNQETEDAETGENSDNEILPDLTGVEIAEIYDVTILSPDGGSTDTIEHATPVRVRVRYLVNDDTVENPVLGVAIRSVDEKYICGVNTLLDKKKIKWKKGLNECVLEYSSFDLTGGNYYFDAAIFDQTATVPIDYKARIKEFFVKMGYIAEGVVVLQHKWN